MKKRVRVAAVFVLFLVSIVAGADVVVLRGGVVIQLARSPVRQGKNVLLTRMDGTLLSVPASEIDTAATAAARSAPAPPPAEIPARPATLAEAARATRDVPKARVRITDADVSHNEAASRTGAPDDGAAAPKEASAAAGVGRVEVAEYSQEKSGEALVVRGALRNPGGTPAINVRMTVTALDAKGEAIGSSEAGVSNGVIDPSGSVNFSVTIPVGSRVVGSLRFAPRWVAPAPPAAPPAPGSEDPANRDRPAASAAPAASEAPRSAPPPAPTPFGRGSLYAPPAPSAPSQPASDGKSGYLPGPSHPGNQPKPPS